MRPLCFALVALLPTSLACHTPNRSTLPPARPEARFDLPLTRAPFDAVHANYKERLEQAYVYRELVGSYTATGRALPELHAALERAGLRASGPPFALYYDDPGKVPVSELKSRACIPVEALPSASLGLLADVLPRAHVVYAYVAGPYPDAPRAYPGLFAYLGRMGWVEAGPIREVYHVPPASVTSFDDLVCEVQVPAAPRP
ncbi:MAG: GyrI-like domain-containing protein [Planctomycetes bacterium]|nr:GyrI-like domain-containing protein [Planctomycetota bacterium]